MTNPLDDAPAPGAMLPALVPPPRSRVNGRLVIAWLVVSLLLAVGCICFLVAGLAQMGWPSFHIVFDGNHALDGLTISGFQEMAGDLLAIAALLAGLLLIVLLPVILVVVLLAALGLPLLAVALGLGIALSPFWAVGLFVWWLVRRGRSSRGARSARMPT